MTGWVSVALVAGIAYLFGTTPVGLIVARAYGVRDLRSRGSGNIGATNVWRVVGARAALWVYIFDIAKGAAAVALAFLLTGSTLSLEVTQVLLAIAAILGNLFPFYLGFKGGKGVNVTLGAFLVMMTWETLICLAVFVAVVAATRYISLGSILAALALTPVLLLESLALDQTVPAVHFGLAALVAILLLVSHRQNIVRLVQGTESRFDFASKTGRGRADA
jgi:glycerol-3-phosphate acyltransferase PlsY